MESAEPESDGAASDPDGEPTDDAPGLSDDELSDVVLHDAVTNPTATTTRLAVRPRRSIDGGYTTSARPVSPNVGASRGGELE